MNSTKLIKFTGMDMIHIQLVDTTHTAFANKYALIFIAHAYHGAILLMIIGYGPWPSTKQKTLQILNLALIPHI